MSVATRGGLWTPAWALLVVAAFVSPMDAFRVGAIGGVADLLLLAAIGLTLLRLLVADRRFHAGPYRWVALSAGVWAVAGLIGTFSSHDTGESLINILRFVVTTIGLPLAVAALAPRRDEVRQMAWAYVFGCIASSAVSFTSANPVVGRSAGLSSHPNVLGISAVFALAILAGLADSATVRGRWLAAAGALVLLGGVSRSGSRAAVVAAVVSATVYLLVTHRYQVAWFLAAVTAGLVAAIALGIFVPGPDSAIGRVVEPSAGTSQSNEERTELTAIVVDRVDRRPVTGSGFANATEAHNIYLQIVDIGGLLAMAGFAALATSILVPAFRNRRDALTAGCLAMYVGYLCSGLVANSLWDRWLWFPIVVGLAAGESARRRAATVEPTAAPTELRPIP